MWKKISEEHPPVGKFLKTKIDDEHGERNEQYLRYDGKKLWFGKDGNYVYYTPTHWWCHV